MESDSGPPPRDVYKRQSLTPECRTLLHRFARFSHEVDAAVDVLFAEHFPEFGSPS